MQPPPEAGFSPQQLRPQFQQPQQYLQEVISAEEIKTLWIGDLEHWMDETYLQKCFAPTEGFLSVKIIQNKHTGYGFLEFVSHAAAQMALQNYNGVHMLNDENNYSLNVEH